MNTCELLSLIGLQLLGSEQGFIGLIGCLQAVVCCHVLPLQVVSLNRSHICTSAGYGHRGAVAAGWVVWLREDTKPAEHGELPRLGCSLCGTC